MLGSSIWHWSPAMIGCVDMAEFAGLNVTQARNSSMSARETLSGT